MTIEQRVKLTILLETVTNQEDRDFLNYLVRNADNGMSIEEKDYFNELCEGLK